MALGKAHRSAARMRTGEAPTPAQVRAYRHHVARTTTPPLLGWTALLVMLVSVAHTISGPAQPIAAHVIDAAAVIALALGALTLGKPWLPGWVIPWYIGFGAVVLIGALLLRSAIDAQATALPFAILVLAAYAPFTLDLRVSAVAAVPMVASISYAVPHLEPIRGADWIIASITAAGLSIVLLLLRLRSVDRMAQSAAQDARDALHDPLTGLLNRRGLMQVAPTLIAAAARDDHMVTATFVDVDGLKSANDRHGHDFGDAVIVSVAGALVWTSRESDVIARWGGDEFVVLSVGTRPADAGHRERLEAAIADSGIDLTRWPGRVSIGSAGCNAADVDLPALLSTADQDMYEGRRKRRRAHVRHQGRGLTFVTATADATTPGDVQ